MKEHNEITGDQGTGWQFESVLKGPEGEVERLSAELRSAMVGNDFAAREAAVLDLTNAVTDLEGASEQISTAPKETKDRVTESIKVARKLLEDAQSK